MSRRKITIKDDVCRNPVEANLNLSEDDDYYDNYDDEQAADDDDEDNYGRDDLNDEYFEEQENSRYIHDEIDYVENKSSCSSYGASYFENLAPEEHV